MYVKSSLPVASWQGGGRGAVAHPNFMAVEKLCKNLHVGKISSKNAKYGAEKPILGKLRGRI